MAVLLDACVPQWLRAELVGFDVTTAWYAGLDQLSDSELLAAIEGRFDILVTLDRNLVYQQKVAGRPICVIVLSVVDQTPEAFRALVPALIDALGEVKPGEVRQVSLRGSTIAGRAAKVREPTPLRRPQFPKPASAPRIQANAFNRWSPNASSLEFRRPRRRSAAAPDHQPRWRTAAWVRWCWSAARASTSTTPPASATSRAWRACGARRSATATPSWSRRRASRWRGSPSRTCSAAAATSRPSRWPRRSRRCRPAPTSKVFFTNSGSEANDTQIKLAWYYNNARGRPKKKKIISRHARLSRHHHRLAPACRGCPVFHADFDLPMARILHTDCPHYGKYAEPGETEEEYATRLAAEPRDADRAGGARDDRRLHRRAGDGRGRRAHSAQDLFRQGAGGAGQARHRLHRRRGDLRLWRARATGGARRRSASRPPPSPWPRPSRRPTCRWAR